MRRFLLLGVALAVSGALFVGAVGANNTGSVTVTSGDVSPASVNGLVEAQLAGQPGAIIANGVGQVVGDIQVYQPGGPINDANDSPWVNAYHLRTTDATTTDGLFYGNCGGAWAPDYSTMFGQVPLTTSWKSTGTLKLAIHPNADTSCVVGGAVVTITYEAF